MWPLVTYSNYFEVVSTVTFLDSQTELISGMFLFKGAHNYIVWLYPMTKWLVMKLANTTQISCVILVYNISLHKGNNNIACYIYQFKRCIL